MQCKSEKSPSTKQPWLMQIVNIKQTLWIQLLCVSYANVCAQHTQL